VHVTALAAAAAGVGAGVGLCEGFGVEVVTELVSNVRVMSLPLGVATRLLSPLLLLVGFGGSSFALRARVRVGSSPSPSVSVPTISYGSMVNSVRSQGKQKQKVRKKFR
jgi:hypothetical protein